MSVSYCVVAVCLAHLLPEGGALTGLEICRPFLQMSRRQLVLGGEPDRREGAESSDPSHCPVCRLLNNRRRNIKLSV